MPAETHMEQPPMTRTEIFELIRDRLSDILEIEPDQIREGDSFADDLDADSLALIELVEASKRSFPSGRWDSALKTKIFRISKAYGTPSTTLRRERVQTPEPRDAARFSEQPRSQL